MKNGKEIINETNYIPGYVFNLTPPLPLLMKNGEEIINEINYIQDHVFKLTPPPFLTYKEWRGDNR